MSGDGIVAQFSMGAVVSRTFGILRRNLLAIGIVAFLTVLLVVAGENALPRAMSALYPGVKRSTMVLPAFAIEMVLYNVAVGAVMRIALADLNRSRIGCAAALAAGLRLVGPLLGLGTVFLLGVVAASVLLVVPGIMLAMAWIVATPVRAMEGPSIRRALSRSMALTKGHRWKLLGLATAFLMLEGVIIYVLGCIGVAVGDGMTPLLRSNIQGAVLAVGSTIELSINSAAIAVCYVELRRVVEGASFRDVVAVFA